MSTPSSWTAGSCAGKGKFTALDHGKAVREAREAAAAVRARAKWPA